MWTAESVAHGSLAGPRQVTTTTVVTAASRQAETRQWPCPGAPTPGHPKPPLPAVQTVSIHAPARPAGWGGVLPRGTQASRTDGAPSPQPSLPGFPPGAPQQLGQGQSLLGGGRRMPLLGQCPDSHT